MVSKIHEAEEPSLLAATVRCTQTQHEYTARLFVLGLTGSGPQCEFLLVHVYNTMQPQLCT